MDWDKFGASSDEIADYYAEQKPKPKRKLRSSLDLPRAQKGERFLRGPVPISWMRLAAKCGPRAEAVGFLLWYAAGWQKSNPAKLTPSILAELEISPKTAKRVLLKMEQLGIVRNEFHRGRSPLVEILQPPEAAAE